MVISQVAATPSATFLEVAQKGYFISDYKIYNHFGGEILDLSGSNGIWPNKLPGDSKALAMSDDGDLFHITQKSVTIGNGTSYTTVFQNGIVPIAQKVYCPQ